MSNIKKRKCWYVTGVPNENGDHIVVVVEEGTPGYYLTDVNYGKDLAKAKEGCKVANERLGHSDDDVIDIVASSMRAQALANGGLA